MTDFFKTNFVQQMKNDPVMNAIFNKGATSATHMQTYQVFDVTDITNPAAPTIANDRRIREKAPKPVPEMYGVNPRVGVGIRYDDVRDYYDTMDNSYWANMMPKNLYSTPTINTPNPLFNLLRKAPINISSIHQSFSS